MAPLPSSQAVLIDTRSLEAALQLFADERDWQRFHTPRNLMLALTGEIGELAELFQWRTDQEAANIAADPDTSRAVRDELADVLLYLIRLSSVLKVDMNEAVSHKLMTNAQKYPPLPGAPA
jgi:dCTP diphosphatase